MNLKEFDAKQFLLEKGERVGLGVALTLMVLMLIFSLFMPSKGFFSGSPAEKAKVLKDGADQLENQLRSTQPSDSDKPESTEGRLTNLDTSFLLSKNYRILGLFEPAHKESPERRPPRILNIVEAVVADADVLIDTYLFSADFKKIWVLRDPEGKQTRTAAGGSNPFSRYSKGGAGGTSMPQGMRPGGPQGLNNLKGITSNDNEYKPTLIPVEDWNNQELTARQPHPLRVVVIGGSFPYRRQLEEFKSRLHKESLEDVRNEELSDKSGPSFDFRGVEVQRVEVDADDKPLGEWKELKLAEHYQAWLKLSYLPFQPEDPKYDVVKVEGLWVPLLREFHPDKKVDPTMRMPGMMGGPPVAGQPMPPGQNPQEGAALPSKPQYPDVIAKLPKLQETLAKLGDVRPAQIAAPKTKPGDYKFDPFRPNAAPPVAQDQPKTGQPDPNAAQDFYPDHVLVRAVDVDVEPGKRYRYRLRIKMANPNYMRDDVASPEYKKAEILTSRDWAEIPQTISLPPELHYYVVDEKKLASNQQINELRRRKPGSAQTRMWMQQNPSADQVVFQFHRWVEKTPLSKDGHDVVPVGQWVVADRVYVGRGEYVGRKVSVDLPIWKYMQNTYVLPAPEYKNLRERLLAKTGIDVDFGFDGSPKEETILVDFEGGRVSGPSKIDDDCRTEVLMLSPDGKLLARNSAKDTDDGDRKDRRNEVLKRVEDVREGKGAE